MRIMPTVFEEEEKTAIEEKSIVYANSAKKIKHYILCSGFKNLQYIVSMAGVAGFEPTNDGVRGRRNARKSPFLYRFSPILHSFLYTVPQSPRDFGGISLI